MDNARLDIAASVGSMEKPMTRKMTIEDLAVMVKAGFDETATKEDLRGVKTDINGMKDGMRQMEERLTRRIEGVEMKISSYA